MENRVLARTTESLHDSAIGLDQRPPAEIAALLAQAQVAAAASVESAVEPISAGAEALAQTIEAGGRIHYVAAGSSGLMAAADAQELGGTFSIPAEQLRIHMAGGLPTGVEMPGDSEDDVTTLEGELSGLTGRDSVIVVSASGTTPYTLVAARMARGAGATVIGIANNAGSELLGLADYAILLETPPEVLSGSTRMGAGTAQKIALNMLSTLMAVRLGHVHDGMMVNLYADNAKLRARAKGIVSRIAEVSEAEAGDALDRARGEVKAAIVMAALGLDLASATAKLSAANGHLRRILEQRN